MKWSTILAASAVLGVQLVAAAPAQAAVGVWMGLPSVTTSQWADAGQPQPATRSEAPPCGYIANPRLAPERGAAASVEAKSSAILGGRRSRLEEISARQSAPLRDAAPTPEVVQTAALVAPAAGGVRCAALALPERMFTPSPGLMAAPRPEDFLASVRLPVSMTGFDRQWDKVRRSGLSTRALGTLASARSLDGDAMIAAVNAWSNARIRYVEDKQLYGQVDHWATANATLRRGAGDCEDIAVVKMQALAALGVAPADMFLTIARDTVRNADHALLVVRMQGRYWVLDNATDQPLDATMSHDYRPIMSFGASGKWLHGYARPAAPAETDKPTLIAIR